jgi:serralysin
LHELGHSLGLKHGNDTQIYGALPFAADSMEYSAMTYRSFVGSDARYVYNEAWSYAQSFMMYDIAALQYMYGADFTTNADDTVYSWSPTSGTTYVNGEIGIAAGSNRVFQTIWDGGGSDTYDLSSYSTDLSVDLAPGEHSIFSVAQLACLGGGPNDGFARGNVFNALQYHGDPASLIENAIGGSGNDTISGNAADNSLAGNAGTDKLNGGDGSDVLDGGPGRDSIYGNRGDDTLGGGDGSDVLRGGSGRDELSGGRGDDTLRGGNGADVLDGGPGRDAFYGGRGADVFVFDEISGNDIVFGFEAEVDMILLNGTSLLSAIADDLNTDGTLDTLISFSSGRSAELIDIDLTALVESDPDAVFAS